MAKFFIDRPVFAWVLSLMIILFGIIAIKFLPIAQYPTIAPPSISVQASYAGASAETTQKTVTAVIEQQLNGIDNLLYMTSSSDSTGNCEITVYFNPGTDDDTAQVQVQNKVSLATPQLPSEVQRTGVTVKKAARNMFLVAAFYSEDGTIPKAEIGNYIASNILDQVQRINGIGQVDFFGAENAMRIWLDANKLNSYGLTSTDVVAALQAQNIQVPVGEVNGSPAVPGAQLGITIQGPGTLETPDEFGAIFLRTLEDGSRVYLRDVARIELGEQSYMFESHYNGKMCMGLGCKLATGANALEVANAVKAKIEELSKYFPEGMNYAFPYDTTLFVRISIHEVIKTLVEAIVLVFIVMLVFLQNFRATFIPTIVVPIALLGTCAALFAMGYSINILTMFAMVLAIGILVDDAIVVIENVERIMTEEGLPPREATRKAMDQISGALVGITLVLTAVFIPMAFFSGSVGVIYRQFSLTLISSMVFSLFLALTLTPALCATMLKHNESGKHRGIAGWFNRNFDRMTKGYKGIVARMIKHSIIGIVSFVAIGVGFGWLYLRLPTAFLPDEDQGNIMALIQLPQTASQERTLKVIEEFENYALAQPEVDAMFAVQGFSFNGRGQNVGLAFLKLKDWSERKGEEHSAEAIAARISGHFAGHPEGMVLSFNLPAISELGNATGFEYQMQDRGGIGHEALVNAMNEVFKKANAPDTAMTGVRLQGLNDGPMLKMNVDLEKAQAHGINISSLYSTIQVAFGSSYVNNFVQGSRVQRVMVQLDAQDRSSPEQLAKMFVRTNSGEMMPLSEIVSFEWIVGAPALKRYNGFPSLNIVGQPKPGRSSGEAMNEFDEIVLKHLPSVGINGVGGEWTGQSLEERTSGSQAPALYALSLIIVFLCLAALYESWSIPFAVLLIVPVGVFGSVCATMLGGLYNDVYFKVGFLVIIGLSAKNAILIIEFAKDLQEQGRNLYDATLEAVQLRLRPILMTSFAFILGVLPLARASGASSAAQNSIGVGVIGGMLASTILGVFLIPCFYVIIRKVFRAAERKPNAIVKH
ncbi:MAG: efflux RND transporter permease subunit [Opitutales bacterium]|nr:efflux RND transporter permease subunit [Opitutales bacterium]